MNVGDATRAFESFKRHRASVNERLDATRMEIDNQLRATTIPPPFQILAQFEALLKERRDLLAELIRLDEQFMVYLLGLRDGQKNDDVETAPGEGRTTERPEAT